MNNATKICEVCNKECHSSEFYNYFGDSICYKCVLKTAPHTICDDKECCKIPIRLCNGCGLEIPIKIYPSGKTETRCNPCKRVRKNKHIIEEVEINDKHLSDNKNEDSDFEL